MRTQSEILARGWIPGPDVSPLERILGFVFRREEIRGPDGDLYMRRFFVSPRIGRWVWQRLIHVFYRSDDDRDPHDHPHAFRTRVLAGGYVDEQWAVVDGLPRVVRQQLLMPADTVLRQANHMHRVRLLDPYRKTWTWVARAPKVREWGFYTPAGFVHQVVYRARRS